MRYLLLLLIFISTDIYSQSRYVKRNVLWNVSGANIDNAGLKDVLSFAFAEFDGSENGLPVYTEVIDWYPESAEVTADFFSVKYESLPEQFKNEGAFSQLTDITNITSRVSIAGNKPYLVISFIPFRKNALTGSVERITEFVLEIESKPGQKALATVKKSSAKVNSVLSAGEWYKIRVPSTGIYKISFEQLKSLGLTDPATLRIFGSGGRMLPEDIRKGAKDDLSPVGFFMSKGSDGFFNQGDYVIFYAAGTETWSFDSASGMYVCSRNHYSDFGYYFLTCNNGSADIIPDAPQPESAITATSDEYDYYYHHELNEVNLIKSGKDFFGEIFSESIIEHDFNFSIPNLVKATPVKITGNVISRSSDSVTFNLTLNGLGIETYRIRPTNVSNYTSIYAYNNKKTTSFYPGSNDFSLKLRFAKREPKAAGWLDYFTLFARAELKLSSDYLLFRDHSTVGNNEVTQFTVNNAAGNIIIWDVTDPNNIINMPWQAVDGKAGFSATTASLREFAIFRNNGDFPTPVLSGSGLGKIANQNLHGINVPDLVIVAHENFLEQANRLAEHRSAKDGLTVFVTTPEHIYNEFSSGAPDVTAIRNFIKSVYDKGKDGGGNQLKHLLLFGGGSYDNKGVQANPGNFILTYQSDNSLSPVSSYVSDDFFALLDPGEQMFDGMLDIGVGRLPVSNEAQAKSTVDKIIEYESPSSMGLWRNSICFIGDDEDNNIHFNQANQLANYVTGKYPAFNVNKIFLDAYKKVYTPVGQRYPDVRAAFNEQVSRGALIVNYTGHGGVEGLAHEQILVVNDIINWRNKGKYPLFMTATCEFTRFDDPSKVSAGEEVFLNPSGGGIALFTTTRLVYSGPNHVLNERFYEIVFESDPNGMKYCLGDIMKYSKNKTGSGVNKRNFSLIGDPSMKLAYPQYHVITDSVNSVHISEPLDTLRALTKVSVSGRITDIKGAPFNSYNGELNPVVYDKPLELSTLGNDGGDKKSFTLQSSILYKGKVSIKDGHFSFSFMVPKDINYAFGEGKLSYYGHDSITDAAGSFTNFIIGGTSENFSNDTEGPEVEVFINNEYFRPGDVTDKDPVLFVKVKDESGINTAGNGIGHDINAVLNNNFSSPFNLNEYFESDLNSYTSGIIRYPLFNLEDGKHTIGVKVWDVYNNSGEGFVEFIVAGSEDFFLNEIFNYPNPFTDRTWFSFGHNKAGVDLTITVDIFNTNGDLVKTLRVKEYGAGFRSQPIEWNGRSDGGETLRQGVYIYRIGVSSSDGKNASKSGKLLLVR